MRREMIPFVISTTGILIFLAHFWLRPPASIALWAVAAILGISSIHHGLRIGNQLAAGDSYRWMSEASVKIGGVILLGVILSVIFWLRPQM